MLTNKNIFENEIISFNNILSNLSPGNQLLLRKKTANILDSFFFDLISQFEIDYFVECGAHEAYASQKFVRNTNKKSIVFEANPITFKKITKLNYDERITYINCGVGDKNCELNFFIPKNNPDAANCSFLLKEKAKLNNFDVKKIKVFNLNTILKTQLKECNQFVLWIDVEGLTFEVLKGSSDYFKDNKTQCLAIKMEVEDGRIWKNQRSFDEILNYLISYNYYPIFRDFEYENQYNIVFIKENLLNKMRKISLEYNKKIFNIKLTNEEMNNSYYEKLRLIKLNLTKKNNKFYLLLLHIFFAIMGSKSSLKYIKTNFFSKSKK